MSARRSPDGGAGAITVEAVARHRNGVGGAPFHVVTFRWVQDEGSAEPRPMVAVLFDEPGTCAVLDREQTRQGNIAFAEGNSWRGDHFEPQLRAAVEAWEAGRDAALFGEAAEGRLPGLEA